MVSQLSDHFFYRGRGRLFKPSRLSRSCHLSNIPYSIMAPFITGETQNAFLELSDVVSNVFHRSQRFSHRETTLGSVKSAIEGLIKPAVCLSFLFYFFSNFSFQCLYLKCLNSDPVAVGSPEYIKILGKAKHSYEVFRKEHNPSFIYPPVYKQLQTFDSQYERTSKSSDTLPSTGIPKQDLSLSPASAAVSSSKAKSVSSKVSLLHYFPSLDPILTNNFSFSSAAVSNLSPPLVLMLMRMPLIRRTR